MGLFGGGNSKSSSSTTNTEQTTANYGGGPALTLNLSNAGNASGKNSTSNVSISTTDYGAVEAGTNLARDALKGFGDLAGSVIDKTLSLANKTQVSEPAQMQDTYVKLALVAGAAVVLIMIFKRG